MPHPSRRHFIQSSAILLAGAITGPAFISKGTRLNLSFSTLGCPDWDFASIVDFAANHGYTGLELRGILRELDLPNAAPFNTEASMAATLALMKKKGLKFVDLGSSATLHFAEGEERKKNLDDARRFIDLAQKINCPFIRVFPNNFPKNQDKATTLQLIATGLLELGGYAKQRGVTVLMETHGDLVKTEDILTILKAAEHPNVGIIWDVSNMWTVTKQPPAQVYQQLKKYIRHTHIKDAKQIGDKLQYTLLGRGEVPIFEALDILHKDGYKGYYSFEWEKLWHPEIEAPEIALADYAQAMQKHFSYTAPILP